jgi:hypothetical protein
MYRGRCQKCNSDIEFDPLEERVMAHGYNSHVVGACPHCATMVTSFGRRQVTFREPEPIEIVKFRPDLDWIHPVTGTATHCRHCEGWLRDGTECINCGREAAHRCDNCAVLTS